MDFRLNQGSKGWFVLIDYIVLLFAIIANCFAMHTVLKSHFGLKAYRRFLLSLVTSDLFVCGINLLNFVNQSLADHLNGGDSLQPCVTNFLRSLLIFGVFANLYNLCGMSVDHYIGIIYPMRYSYLTNKGVARHAVFLIWVVAFSCGFADFPIVSIMYFFANDHSKIIANVNPSPMPVNRYSANCTAPKSFDLMDEPFLKRLKRSFSDKDFIGAYPLLELENVDLIELTRIIQENIGSLNKSLFQNTPCDEANIAKESQFMRELKDFQEHYDHDTSNNWCLYSNSNKIWLELFVVFCTVVCFIFLIICYGKIFRTVALKIRERSIRKLVVTTCLLLGNFALCWCPLMFFEITMWAIVSHEPNYQNGPHPDSLLIAHNVFNTLFLSHPLLDPIVYVARLPNVQRYVIRHYGWLWCWRFLGSKLTSDDRRASAPQCRLYVSGSAHSTQFTTVTRTTRRNSMLSDYNDSDTYQDSPLNYGISLKHVKSYGSPNGTLNNVNNGCTLSVSQLKSTNRQNRATARRSTANSIALERVSSDVIAYLREESAFNRDNSLDLRPPTINDQENEALHISSVSAKSDDDDLM